MAGFILYLHLAKKTAFERASEERHWLNHLSVTVKDQLIRFVAKSKAGEKQLKSLTGGGREIGAWQDGRVTFSMLAQDSWDTIQHPATRTVGLVNKTKNEEDS